jgi:hypothetical protein
MFRMGYIKIIMGRWSAEDINIVGLSHNFALMVTKYELQWHLNSDKSTSYNGPQGVHSQK